MIRALPFMRLPAIPLGLALASCASAGLYGHSPSYVPLGEEESAAATAVDYDPVMAKRSPEKWKGKLVSVFGVVLSRTAGAAGAAGAADAKLSLRTLEPRNLCDSSDEDSCRVTVSEHEHAIVHARLRLNVEDDLGERSLGPRSLVRVLGVVSDEVDPSDGEPVLQARYYRHWPRGFYVTTADRKFMRQ